MNALQKNRLQYNHNIVQLVPKFYKLSSSDIKNNITNGSICIPTISGNDYIPTRNILYCVADGSYCSIYTNKGMNYISKTLKWVFERLPSEDFIRVHNSYLVNKKSIVHLQLGTQATITLTDGSVIPVARSRRKYVKLILNNGIYVI